jgi:hypothetical protein
VNCWLPALFSPADALALEKLPPRNPGAPAAESLESGVRRATRQRIQDESLARLKTLSVPLRKLELLLSGAATPEAVSLLARHFDE